jgi:hypothetical protein
MTNPANDIFQQANQGSVAAIIQVLNDKLGESGVRTRAILADGILQLLCEAATPEQLERSQLVEQVRQTLETIAPRNIRRVNINSRIVREQQLLWLEAINRDPNAQLLWSQEILLKQPNFLRQWLKDRQIRAFDASQAALFQRSSRQRQDQRQFQRGWLIGGMSVGLLLLAGWAVATQIGGLWQPQAKSPEPTPSAANSVNTTTPSAKPQDAFAEAVRIAEKASQSGLTARSSAEWLDLATRWQQASDLMATVATNDSRYQTAQSRVAAYRKNREAALLKAQQQP